MGANEGSVAVFLILPESDSSKNVVITSQYLWRLTHMEKVAKEPEGPPRNTLETSRNKESGFTRRLGINIIVPILAELNILLEPSLKFRPLPVDYLPQV
jgi:hypothetical protein